MSERQHMREMRQLQREIEQESPEEAIARDPSLLEEARAHVANLDLPGTPGVGHSRYLIAAELPVWCGNRKVTDLRIEEGRPRHGEMRSDNHISRFVVQAPLGHFDVEHSADDHAETCSVRTTNALGVYSYNAYHHISGSESLHCLDCEAELYGQQWG